jgi:hypothetical protein
VAEQFNLATLLGADSQRLRVFEHTPLGRSRRRLEAVDQRHAAGRGV